MKQKKNVTTHILILSHRNSFFADFIFLSIASADTTFHTCLLRVGRIAGALAPHLLRIYKVRYVNSGKYHFLLFTVAPPLRFASAYPVSRMGGTGG